VGCDGKRFGRADHPPVTVEFIGRVVNAETGDPVGNVRVSVDAVKLSSEVGFNIQPAGWVLPTDSVTSGGDGTFTLVLNVPRNWSSVDVKLTDPGYEEMRRSFDHITAGTRAEIRMYPTLVIRPGESIEIRIDDPTAYRCAFAGAFLCRRVLVEASQGEPVKLEIVAHDTSKPMGLVDDWWSEEPVLHLMAAPGAVVYVYGPGTGRLTASR
jgi:hypothetical protein